MKGFTLIELMIIIAIIGILLAVAASFIKDKEELGVEGTYKKQNCECVCR